MRFGRRLAATTAAAVGLVLATSTAAHAGYYTDYSDIASTPDSSGATAAQGFAVGANFAYSIKGRHDKDGHYDRSVIYRVNRKTGDRKLMHNATSNSSYNTWLGHANDMTIVDAAGQHFFYVVTMSKGSTQLVKLRYSGSNYYKAGSYKIRHGDSVLAASGINRYSVTDAAVTFLFKKGRTVYQGTVSPSASSGTIRTSKLFTLKVSGAKVGYETADLSGYLDQGFYYNEATQDLYYPLTKGNRSVVLVYRNVTATTAKPTLTSTPGLSFRITSKKYSKFEIEGVGVAGHKLYFSTNRSGGADGVQVFKGYSDL